MKIVDYISIIWNKVKRSLAIINREPTIKKKYDLKGNRYWQVHNFNTNQSYKFTSEQDVRIWIEDYYSYFD